MRLPDFFIYAGKRQIATVDVQVDLPNEANARLIAQAPAMAAALREFFDAYKAHPERLGSSSKAHAHLEAARALLRAVDGTP